MLLVLGILLANVDQNDDANWPTAHAINASAIPW
jgi:hypothetical protein